MGKSAVETEAIKRVMDYEISEGRSPIDVSHKGAAIFLLVGSLLMGCAHMQVQQRKSELEQLINPLLGKSQEEVVLAVGVPTKTQYIGNLEVYQYYRSYGTRGNVWISPNEYISTAGARTWEAYDKIDIYFKNNVMVKWDAYIQR